MLALACGALACGEAAVARPPDAPVAGWSHWGGDAGGARFSPLDEITPRNVGALEVAWTFHTGDWDPSGEIETSFQATPVLRGDTLYFCSPFNRVFALDAESGMLRWSFDPKIARTDHGHVCRGVALWEDARAAPGARCRVRVFSATYDARLLALDAENGSSCADFGANGEVDLEAGLGAVVADEVRVTSPPTLIGDVVATGSLIADNRRVDMPGGVVRGFDARTGALRWAFDPAPPGSAPLAPAADGSPRFQRGTPNAWGVFSADPARDLLFMPTGNPSNDFFRGAARGEIDHYGSSVVALRGSTGAVVWRFQTVHHDLWDYDVGAQPSLFELEIDGGPAPALALATKVGHVFLLHRETGAPLFPVEERAVPQSDAAGEISAPTQPFPSFPPPLHPHGLREGDLFGLTPWDRAKCREQLAGLRNEGAFTPPSLAGSVQYPGVAGGVNWGGAAIDAERGLLVLAQSRLAMVERLVPRAQASEVGPRTRASWLVPMDGAPYALEQRVFVSPLGVPCTTPPWFELIAIDLARREIAWRVPLGTTRGIAPWPFWLPWAPPGMGGPLLTRSGLVFIGAAMDGYLRAFDAATGDELWRDHLPAGAHANPMTYRVRPGGKQFIVIAAGGHVSIPSERGDALVAYALP
ncbi:MAG TPA: pyrroloquinoline quinone-dependent dehydrogenase [Myxococcota bacterium]|nr:pyrroloquinoline quinone-dependent dehydrogenase [Myxococcota bacterium]